MATATLAHAKAGHAPRGAVTQVAGALVLAAAQTAHAVLAARGEWVTKEKGLLARAGLADAVDALTTGLTSDPEILIRTPTEAERLTHFPARDMS
nr:hypothetical protein [Streptomyces sp. RG38]